jgi:hypothetical protein
MNKGRAKATNPRKQSIVVKANHGEVKPTARRNIKSEKPNATVTAKRMNMSRNFFI